MELIIKDMKSLNAITEALILNRYIVKIETVFKAFPENGIDHFKIEIQDG